jgi:hypothetical protein
MITGALCNSFKLELGQAIHKDEDDYFVALYLASANLDKHTTRYTPEGEHPSAGGYVARGRKLGGRRTLLDGATAILTFDSPVWRDSTIAAAGALIYNATREDRAVCVIEFDEEKRTVGAPFYLMIPPPTADLGLIRIS